MTPTPVFLFLFVPVLLCRATEVFPVVHKEKLAIRVVDGKQARPQSGVLVLLAAGYTGSDLNQELWHEEGRADGDGVVRVPDELSNFPYLRVQVLKRHGCEPGRPVFSVDRIRGEGLSGLNRCGAAVVSESPGMLTVFVRAKKAAGSKH